MQDYPFIGDTFTTPKGGTLTILGVVPRVYGKHLHVWLGCSICSNDGELWPEGSICCNYSNLRRGGVPCSCSRKPTLTIEQHLIISNRTLSETKYKISDIRRVKGCHSVMVDVICPDHGSWNCSVYHLKSCSFGCQKCYQATISGRVRKPESAAISEILAVAEKNGHRYIGMHSVYTGAKSRIVLECADHGEFSGLISNYLRGKASCKICRYEKTSSTCADREPGYIESASIAAVRAGLLFAGWLGKFAGSSSIARVLCKEHGESSLHYGNLLNGAGCKSCAGYGFQPSQPGYLYCLQSCDGSLIKVGISNKLDQRMVQLARATPFSFTLTSSFLLDGVKAARIERECHSMFGTAGLFGFYGSTEWLKYDPEIFTHIKKRAA